MPQARGASRPHCAGARRATWRARCPRSGSPDGWPVLALALTACGHRLFGEIAACFVQRDRHMLAPLPAPERRTFSRLLNRIAEASAAWRTGDVDVADAAAPQQGEWLQSTGLAAKTGSRDGSVA
jgi:hypothetical protein